MTPSLHQAVTKRGVDALLCVLRHPDLDVTERQELLALAVEDLVIDASLAVYMVNAMRGTAKATDVAARCVPRGRGHRSRTAPPLTALARPLPLRPRRIIPRLLALEEAPFLLFELFPSMPDREAVRERVGSYFWFSPTNPTAHYRIDLSSWFDRMLLTKVRAPLRPAVGGDPH